MLPFGSPEYVGLAFSVIFMSVLLQLFGSPFLKTTFIFWGLMFGCFMSAISSYTAHAPRDKTLCTAEPDAFCAGGFANAEDGKAYSYWNNLRVKDAPGSRSCGQRRFRSASTARTSCPFLSGTL